MRPLGWWHCHEEEAWVTTPERVTAYLGIQLWMVLEKLTSKELEKDFMLYFRDY